MCIHVATFVSFEINPYVHVLHVCAYMCIHDAAFVSFEINPYVHVLYVLAYMCIHVYTCVYMYTYVDHIQTTYTLLCVGAHNRPETSPGGGCNQRAPLRTAMGSSPATLSRDQGPIPTPVLAHPCALHALGGPKLPPCTAHGPSNHNGHSMIPS